VIGIALTLIKVALSKYAEDVLLSSLCEYSKEITRILRSPSHYTFYTVPAKGP